jgi:hypothetical protein
MEGIPLLAGRYSVTMDLWPQQDEPFNRQVVFPRVFYAFEPAGGA